MNVFDFVKSINDGTKSLMNGSENDELAEKIYAAFIVNRALSYFPDTILYVQELNKYNKIDNKLQYEFLLNAIRPRKRFAGKWPKREQEEKVDLVKEYYQINQRKAQFVVSILSDEQIAAIRKEQEKGGL